MDAQPNPHGSPPPPEPPEDLLVRVARGEEDAFAAVYDLMAPLVHGLVERVVRNPSMAEETTQEVFVQVWRTAARYDRARGSARAWIATIAHGRAVDRVRREQAARDREDRSGRRDRRPDYDEVAEQVELRIEHQQVRRALGTLTRLQRQALELAYYGGHTYLEVAELLDTPLGTVKTRLRDGLGRLRDELGVGR